MSIDIFSVLAPFSVMNLKSKPERPLMSYFFRVINFVVNGSSSSGTGS